jgi:protein-tyrosine phosphatase
MVDTTHERLILFPQVFNLRDLGGVPTSDGRTVRWRRLYRSDTLAGLAEDDRAEFGSLGVRTVVDLRRPIEVEKHGRVPEWDGLVHRNIVLEHQEWHENPYQDGDDPVRYLADRYRDMSEQAYEGIAEAVGLIADGQAAPVLVHCMAGKDRTGVVIALTLALLGVTDDEIDAEYSLSTAGNERFIAWRRANGNPDAVMLPWFRSWPGTMRLFLTELRERHGSVQRYLTRAGLDPAAIPALRADLLA